MLVAEFFDSIDPKRTKRTSLFGVRCISCSSNHGGDALDEPGCRQGADAIGGGVAQPGEVNGQQSLGKRLHGKHRKQEEQLAGLHPDIEGKKRQRHVRLRKSDLLQRASKAETMQKPEGEGDDPGPRGWRGRSCACADG